RPGCAARKPGSSGAMYWRPNEAETVTRRVPPTSPPPCLSRSPSNASSSTRARPSCARARPSGVGCSRRVVRCSRRTPSSRSSRFRRWLARATERSRWRAAALIEARSSTCRTRAISPTRSMIINIPLTVLRHLVGFSGQCKPGKWIALRGDPARTGHCLPSRCRPIPHRQGNPIMQYRSLGASGLKVSALGFGVGTFGGKGPLFSAWGDTGADEARRLLDIALDAGVNFFDSADVYSDGASETVLGAAIRGRRDRVVLSTKTGLRLGDGPNDVGASRHRLLRSVDASLRRLGTDYIDLLQ